VGVVDLDAVARATDGYSGADIALVIDSATERAMQRSLGGGAIQPIRQDDLDASVREVNSTIGGWFDLARNYATFNNDDGAYDDLVQYLQRSSKPRGRPPDRRWFR
jgi:SpoVK/Ycf46/Vps4 family AAA+-type ATPase